MKKHNFLRKLYILVALLFVGQLIVPAYAAETYWTEPWSGREFFGEVLRTSERYTSTLWEEYPSITHTSGTDTWLNGHRIYLPDPQGFDMNGHKYNLEEAWRDEGFIDCKGEMRLQVINPPFYIPANAPSGTYRIGAVIRCGDGLYAVYNLDLGSPFTEDTGEFVGAFLTTGDCNYRQFPVS